MFGKVATGSAEEQAGAGAPVAISRLRHRRVSNINLLKAKYEIGDSGVRLGGVRGSACRQHQRLFGEVGRHQADIVNRRHAAKQSVFQVRQLESNFLRELHQPGKLLERVWERYGRIASTAVCHSSDTHYRSSTQH